MISDVVPHLLHHLQVKKQVESDHEKAMKIGADVDELAEADGDFPSPMDDNRD